jgi:hypothetical protein
MILNLESSIFKSFILHITICSDVVRQQDNPWDVYAKARRMVAFEDDEAGHPTIVL